MSFTHPAFLLLFPLVFLPVLIHLLNRKRYRVQPWPSNRFLRQVLKQAQGYWRLRQFLILACRVLLLVALLAILVRPQSGGRFFRLFQSAPDRVILLLDRSTSMELRASGQSQTHRERSIEWFQSEGQLMEKTRFVLIDSAALEAVELDSLAQLSALTAAAPTDASGSASDLLRRAAEVLAETGGAEEAEIWFAGDRQRIAWEPESLVEWREAQEALQNLAVNPQLRRLDFPIGSENNVSLDLLEWARLNREGESRLNLRIRIRRGRDETERIPVTVMRNGIRTEEDFMVTGREFETLLTLEGGGPDQAIEGWIAPGNDPNVRDHTCFFALAAEKQAFAAVVAEDDGLGRTFSLAIDPSPGRLNREATRYTTAQADTLPWEALALVVWQGALPTGRMAGTLETFVQEGGYLLICPSLGDQAPGDLFGLRRTGVETADEPGWSLGPIDPFPGHPLGPTWDGKNLRLEDLRFVKRSAVQWEDGRSLARYAGAGAGQFLWRKTSGRGEIYAISSLPDPSWSNLDEGLVLVPLLQRLLEAGRQRFETIVRLETGDALPPDLVGKPIERLDDGSKPVPGNQRFEAGIYRIGQRTVVVNRPSVESDPRAVSDEEMAGCLAGINDSQLAAEGVGAGSGPKEIWRWFALLFLVFLVIEASLSLPPVRSSVSESPTTAS
ncbi:MAG: BatA domain-containing protein [Verrucomicrobiota bacterium]